MTTTRSSQSPAEAPAPAGQPNPPRRARFWQRALLVFATVIILVAGVAVLWQTPAVNAARLDAELPLGCFEIVQNGGFEQINAAWSIDPSPSPSQFSNVQVFAGNLSMLQGILDTQNVAGQSTVSQVINLPAEANSIILTFRYYGQADSATGAGDFQYLDFYDANTNAFLQRRFQVTNSSMMWLGAQYSMTELRGRNVRLVFGVANDGANGRLAMFLDNVSVYYCTTTPTAWATPTWTPNWPSPTPTWPPDWPSPTPTWTPLPVWPTPIPTWPSPQPTIWPTWTPPPTVMPTFTPLPPQPGGCTDILVNGNMESNAGWEFGRTPLIGSYSTGAAVDGTRSALLGTWPGGRADVQSFSSIRQLVTLPANASSQLRWWHMYGTQGELTDYAPSGTDRQELIILDQNETTLAVLSRVRRNDNVFLQEVTDLTQYAGRTIYVYWNAYNDGDNLRTWMYLDAVQLCVNPITTFGADTAAQPAAAQPMQAVAPSTGPTTDAFYAQPTFFYPTAQAAQQEMQFATPVPQQELAPAEVAPIDATPLPTLASEQTEFSSAAVLTDTLAQPGVVSLGQEEAVEATLTAIAQQTAQATAIPANSGEGRSRTTAVMMLCGIVLVIGLLAVGIIRVITRSDT